MVTTGLASDIMAATSASISAVNMATVRSIIDGRSTTDLIKQCLEYPGLVRNNLAL